MVTVGHTRQENIFTWLTAFTAEFTTGTGELMNLVMRFRMDIIIPYQGFVRTLLG
jgi:hypothetical protein